jgi:twitching motility protein PilT
LAAMIEEINKNYAKHIITIEDPIEYIFEPKKSIIEQKQL